MREQQPTRWGWTPHEGWVEMRARATISPRSMVSLWMVGLEQDPQECAEICVMEVFGDAVVPGESTGVGAGLHTFRDLDVPEDFAVTRLPIDVADWHTYACDWHTDHVDHYVDGVRIRRTERPPRYPV